MREIETARIRVRAFVENSGKILLVKEVHPDTKTAWETPGGGVRKGENLSDALKREVLEETGHEVKIKKIQPNVICIGYDIHLIFVCELGKKIREPNKEIKSVKWFSKSEVSKILKKKEHQDYDKDLFEKFVGE